MLKLLRNIYMYIYVQQNKAWNCHDSFCANGTVIMMLFFVGLGLRSFFAESLPRILKYSPFPIWVVTVIVFLVMAVLFCLMYLDMVRSGRYMDMVSDARFHGRKATFKAICIIMSSWVFYSIMIFDVYPWAYDRYPDNIAELHKYSVLRLQTEIREARTCAGVKTKLVSFKPK